MDLVDIDQVLDNLELREATEEIKELKLNSSSSSQSNAASSKNFVGVSQVFNHLDDYTRNVEELGNAVPKYIDVDCPLPKKQVSEQPTTSSSSCATALQQYEEDDEEEASSDIKKFTENKFTGDDFPNYEDEEDFSDSLTTSSSSNFSSGPSAEAASTTDERLSPLPQIPQITDTVKVVEEVQPQETANDCSASNTRLRSLEPPVGQNNVQVEDIANGLSSISISSSANSQSVLPCETATASSALHQVLNELSEQTSISPLSQLREERTDLKIELTNKTDSVVSALETDAREKDLEKNPAEIISKLEAEPDCVDKNICETEPIQQKQQPVTFTSTMDEISDTELDSMLQEMDIETDAVEIQTEKTNSMNVSQTIPTKTEEESNVETVSDEHADNQTSDSINADSFSQASTVEFSEIRAQNAIGAEQIENEATQMNNSYTSSESSLDEQNIAVNADENEVQSTQKPQRPTTLDLNTIKSSLHTNAGQTPPGNCANVQPEMQPQTETTDQQVGNSEQQQQDVAEACGYSDPNENLGRVPPIWVPDNMATGCMQCQTKFTMIKRRHHCRACGKVLCSVCCSQKFKLEFLNEPESRVCVQCYLILAQREQSAIAAASTLVIDNADANLSGPNAVANPIRSPNPNNPMEYCSTIPPHRQVSAESSALPPVIVPVGVLKKDGSHSSNSSNSSSKQARKRKSVMFSDGIAPGSDLAVMEQHQWSEAKHARRIQQGGARNAKPSTPVKTETSTDATTLGMVAQLFRGSIPPVAAAAAVNAAQANCSPSKKQNTVATASPNKVPKPSSRARHLPPSGCDEIGCFIPAHPHSLPPLYIAKDERSCEFDYKDVPNDFELIERLQMETLKFAVTKNFFVFVKIQQLKCCLNRTVINFTTNGMHHVGNDEIIILLEFEPPKSKDLMTEPPLPRDIFVHLHEIYREAEQGSPICELAYTSPRQERFLGTHDYGGFIFIRPTFQCLQDIILPENPFLIAILIHRTEVPWAKVFPLRLMLRLGAQYRYYPCPHVSMRHRESVYADIAQTIINFLADFRNFSYTLPNIRGMYIHMEDRQTTVLIPRNRQEDVIKAMNDSSDHILAFGGNFSKSADGHLVCMQNTNDERTEMYAYSTQAINIQGQPRKITGASFFVLNESLKSSSGLLAKCSIVEDGLMVQILPSKMEEVRNALNTQKDIDIVCGPANADDKDREVVRIKWVENDKDFNVGVKSPIDDKPLEGVSSMRVHANFNYANTNYSIRLTEIFIIKYDEWYSTQPSFSATSADITRISEQVARSTSLALIPFLDLLAASGNCKIGLRATLHQDNVCYEAGACGSKLPPLYMNALDNHLIPTLHNESNGIEDTIILELFFYILNV